MEDSFHNLNQDEKNFINLILGEEEPKRARKEREEMFNPTNKKAYGKW